MAGELLLFSEQARMRGVGQESLTLLLRLLIPPAWAQREH